MKRRIRLWIGAGFVMAVTLLAAFYLWLGLDPPAELRSGPPAPAGAASGPPRWSLLAAGDTGNTAWLSLWETERSVGRGMAAEDVRQPVDALLLLGDNFYWDGLVRQEMVARLRRNVVGPLCRFVDLGGPRSSEVAGACALPERDRNPVPILAVLGNHDHKAPESAALQRSEVPAFVPNWHVPAGLAEVVEPSPGLSLVLLDSTPLYEGASFAPVREALSRARGRWRILALHHPIAVREGQEPDRVAATLRDLLAESTSPVQIILSGHRHNLQIIALDPPVRGLQVISGAGSKPRPLREPAFRGRHFGIATAGFARIDLVGEGKAQGLVVSLFTVPRRPIHRRGPRLVSRWWVSASGESGQIFPPPKS